MDCNHARMLLIFCRDQASLDPAESGALASHLGQCAACRTWSATEQQWDTALGRAMHAVDVPAGLPARILQGLDKGRPVWRRWPAWAAAAAVVLLAIGFAGYAWLGARITLNPGIVYWEASAKTYAARESVEDWFRDQGFAVPAPAQFNYGLLYSYDLATFLGRRVPKLIFLNRGDGAIAEVYILSERHFKLDPNLPQNHPGSSHTVQVLDDCPPGFRYVVVYTGRNLEPFLDRRGAV